MNSHAHSLERKTHRRGRKPSREHSGERMPSRQGRSPRPIDASKIRSSISPSPSREESWSPGLERSRSVSPGSPPRSWRSPSKSHSPLGSRGNSMLKVYYNCRALLSFRSFQPIIIHYVHDLNAISWSSFSSPRSSLDYLFASKLKEKLEIVIGF